jgi:hypothetical protein
LAITLGLICCALGVSACGPRNFVNENDKLRREKMSLQREIESLRQKLARRSGQLETLRGRLAGPAGTQPTLMEPVLSDIQLGDYSGPIDADGDGQHDTLRLYVDTLDQEGRLLPVVAEARVQVVHIPDKGEPQAVASNQYSAEQFNEAYRSSFTGKHYTLEVDLPRPLPKSLDQITVKLTLKHGPTGNRFTAQETYRLTRDQAAAPSQK